ncbi:MAG TPA: ribosome maturation factor RimM [Syntrophales bacterium]|nr:ribosome maturation factor RimM [Syntrophales bacterium]
MNPTEFFEIGKIVRSCGLRGRMKAISYLESNSTLQSVDEVYVRQKRDKTGPFKLKAVTVRRKIFFLEIEGVEDRESADALAGCQVLIPVNKLEKLPEGEYYWRDIIGLKVVTEEGQVLGVIEAIFATGSNDVYVCRGGGRELLLPSIAEVIHKIDVDRGTVVVRLLEGL